MRGLGLIPGAITRFTVDASEGLAVPHIGWNGVNVRRATAVLGAACSEHFYFVHSFQAQASPANADWVLTTTNYGTCEFISSVRRGNILVGAAPRSFGGFFCWRGRIWQN